MIIGTKLLPRLLVGLRAVKRRSGGNIPDQLPNRCRSIELDALQSVFRLTSKVLMSRRALSIGYRPLCFKAFTCHAGRQAPL